MIDPRDTIGNSQARRKEARESKRGEVWRGAGVERETKQKGSGVKRRGSGLGCGCDGGKWECMLRKVWVEERKQEKAKRRRYEGEGMHARVVVHG
jgi:hypothetical protein